MDNYEIESLTINREKNKYSDYMDNVQPLSVGQSAEILSPTSTHTIDFTNESFAARWALYNKAYLSLRIRFTFPNKGVPKAETWFFKNTSSMVQSGTLSVNNTVIENCIDPEVYMGALNMVEYTPSAIPGLQFFGFNPENLGCTADGNVSADDIKAIKQKQNRFYNISTADLALDTTPETYEFILPLNWVFQFHRSLTMPIANSKISWKLRLNPFNMFYNNGNIDGVVSSYQILSVNLNLPTVHIPTSLVPSNNFAKINWGEWSTTDYKCYAGSNTIKVGTNIVGAEKLVLGFSSEDDFGAKGKLFGSFRGGAGANIAVTNFNVLVNSIPCFPQPMDRKLEFYREFKKHTKYRGDLPCAGPIFGAEDYLTNGSIYVFDLSKMINVFRTESSDIQVRFNVSGACKVIACLKRYKSTVFNIKGEAITT